jgi:lipoate-protein ligase A
MFSQRIKYLDLTLPTPAENLACDEALLDWCEETGDAEILRVWEPSEYFVVVGYANKVELEVNRQKCRDQNISVLRRCSGGGAVVQGPGCLNYSLVLQYSENESLQTIPQANQFIMECQRQLVQEHLKIEVEVKGHTDLALDGMKFSGNAQRRKKNFLLFHGTFLLNFEIPVIASLLKMPSKQPDYRENRTHESFVTNLHRPAEELKQVLRCGWEAAEEHEQVAIPYVSKLLREKYAHDDWNFKF